MQELIFFVQFVKLHNLSHTSSNSEHDLTSQKARLLAQPPSSEARYSPPNHPPPAPKHPDT